VPEVERLVSQKTKIPVTKLTREETGLLLNLERKLHRRIIGQDQAIKAIADAVRRARTGLKEKNKPIASFLFAGPTGVGKTETAKALAEEFFSSEKVMIRLDMSEYQTTESVDRLLDFLPEAVRHQPYTLVLLDEIEKAQEKILNLFLQVLDDARLTDSTGRTVDFSNTIIIATTNARGELEDTFPLEFLNRFTAIITFSPLTKKEIEAIVTLKLNRLSQELKKQEVEISFPRSTVAKIAADGFSAKWGGRQVDRTIQKKISNVIAKKILEGKIKSRQPVEFNL